MDPAHSLHEPAHIGFAAHGQHGWATCSVTENGLLHIAGNSRYVNFPCSPAAVTPVLASLTAQPGHVFWSDDVSLMDATRLHAERLLHHSQVTDSCFLALAVAHGGILGSFDRRLVPDAVQGGRGALVLI